MWTAAHLKFRLNCSQLCSDEEIKRIAASSSEEAFFPLKRYSRGMIFAITVAGSFIIFNLNCRTLGEVDTVPAGYLAWGLLHGKGFDLTPYAGDPEQLGKYIGDAILPGKNGRYVSKSPPGSAVSAIPVYTVASVLTNSIPTRSHMNTLGKQAAALYCALAVGFFMIIVTRLFPTAAVPATILFALGTTLWSTASQALWMHGPANILRLPGIVVPALPTGSTLTQRGILGWAMPWIGGCMPADRRDLIALCCSGAGDRTKMETGSRTLPRLSGSIGRVRTL